MNSNYHIDLLCLNINISFTQIGLLYIITFLTIFHANSQTPGGYELWLGYPEIDEPTVRSGYVKATNSIFFNNITPILKTAKNELVRGLDAILGQASDMQYSPNLLNTMWVAKKADLNLEYYKSLKFPYAPGN